ncbi:hypothetical protein [Streptomyces flavidovirens]|nr:hypothetical protein [Streptomyces flavidovirens]
MKRFDEPTAVLTHHVTKPGTSVTGSTSTTHHLPVPAAGTHTSVADFA